MNISPKERERVRLENRERLLLASAAMAQLTASYELLSHASGNLRRLNLQGSGKTSVDSALEGARVAISTLDIILKRIP